MDIKERIETVIARKGTNKANLADKMGKIKQNMNSLLTDPKWSTIEAVAEALEISPEELLFDHEQTASEQGVMVCPKCKAALRISIESVS